MDEQSHFNKISLLMIMNFNKKEAELLDVICSKYPSVEFLCMCTKNGMIVGHVFRNPNKFKMTKQQLDFHALHTSFRSASRRNVAETFGESEYSITKYEKFLTVTVPFHKNFVMGVIDKNSHQVMEILSTMKLLFQDLNYVENSFSNDFRN